MQDNLGDLYEHQTRGSLFGALVQSYVHELDAKLEIPELSEDQAPCIRVPKLHQVWVRGQAHQRFFHQ